MPQESAAWTLAAIVLVGALVGVQARDDASAGQDVLRLEGVEVHAGRFPMDGQNARFLLPVGFAYEPFVAMDDRQAAYWVEGGTYHRAWLDGREVAGGSFAFYGIVATPTAEHRGDGGHLWLLGLVASDPGVAARLQELGLPGVAVGAYAFDTTALAGGAALVTGETTVGAMPFAMMTARGNGEAVTPSPLLERWFLVDEAGVAGYLDREITMTWAPGGAGYLDAGGDPARRPEAAGQGGAVAGADYTFHAMPAARPTMQFAPTLSGDISFVCTPDPPAGAVCLPVVDDDYKQGFPVTGRVDRIEVEVRFGAASVLDDLEVCLRSPYGTHVCELVSQEPTGSMHPAVNHSFQVIDSALLTEIGEWQLVFAADSPQQGTYQATVRIAPLTALPSDGAGAWPPVGVWPLWLAPASLLGAAAAMVRVARRYKPVEFFLVFAAFTRIKRDEALDNERRAALLECIRDNPGCGFADLRRALEVGSGSLAHHLKVLEQQDFVRGVRDGVRLRFYVRGPAIPREAYLTFTQRSVLDAVHSNPGIAQGQLARLVGLPRQNVAYHVRRLAEMGRIAAHADGAHRRYYAQGGTA